LLVVIPALRITVEPALGDDPFVKLKVVAQNRCSLNEGSLTETGIVTIVSLWLLSVCYPVSSSTAECRRNKNTPTNNVTKWRNAPTFAGNDNRPMPS